MPALDRRTILRGSAGASLAAQPVDQRLEIGKAAEPAEAVGGLGEIEIRQGVREAPVRRDPEMLAPDFFSPGVEARDVQKACKQTFRRRQGVLRLVHEGGGAQRAAADRFR